MKRFSTTFSRTFFSALITMALLFVLLAISSNALSTHAQSSDITTITVRANGTTGKEKLKVLVAGKKITTFKLSKSLTDYTFTTTKQVHGKNIKVNYTNDRNTEQKKRNVFVDYIQVDNEVFQSEAKNVLSKGSWDGSCKKGKKKTEWLHCGGWFRYKIPAESATPSPQPDPTPTPTPTPTPDPSPQPEVPQNIIATYDTAWELLTFAKNDQEIINYLDHANQKGYDGVLLSMLNHIGGNTYGTSAYHGELQSYVSGDKLYVTDTHLAYTEHVLNLAHERGLKVGLVPAWSFAYLHDPNQPRATKCNKGVLQPHNSYAFGDQIGKKIGSHPAIDFFIMGGDNLCQLPAYETINGQQVIHPAVPEQGDVWRNMAAALYNNGAKQVTYHTSPAGHLNSYHLASQYAGESWVSFLFPETGSCAPAHDSSKVIQKLVSDFNKPVFAAEMRYYSLGADWCSTHTKNNPVNEHHIKEDITSVIAAGASGYAYGDWNRWNWCTQSTVGRIPYDNPCQSQGVPFTYNSPGENAVFEVVRN